MFVGLCLVFAGLALAVAPLESARFANWLRFVPYRSDERALRGYRVSGVAIAVLGAAVATALR